MVSSVGIRRWVMLVLVVGCHHQPPSAPAASSVVDPEARVWFLRARVAEERGDVDEAARAWAWVVRLDRGPEAIRAYAAWLARQGRGESALDVLLAAAERFPDDSGVLEDAGLELAGRADARAAPLLDRALAAGASWRARAARLELADAAADDGTRARLLADWVGDAADPDEALARGRRRAAAGDPAAVDDLFRALTMGVGDRAAAEALVALSSRGCRLGTAWRWARGGSAVDAWPDLVRTVARRAGDAPLELRALAAQRALADTAGLRREHARAAIRAGRPGEALTLLGRDDDDESRLVVVDALLAQGRGDEAARVAHGIAPSSPWSAAAADLESRALVAAGRRVEAARVLDAALARSPGEPTLAWGRAVMRAEEARLGDAEALVAGVAAWSEADRALRRGVLADLAGDADRALAAYASAAAAGSALARRRRAELLDRRGDASALTAWREAVKNDPRDVGAWLAIARLDPSGAAAAVRGALDADPCDVDALYAAHGVLPGDDWVARAREASPLWTRP